MDLGTSPPRRWQEGLKSKREREKAAKGYRSIQWK